RFTAGSGIFEAASTRLFTLSLWLCDACGGIATVLLEAMFSWTPRSKPVVKPEPKRQSHPRRGVANHERTSIEAVCGPAKVDSVIVPLTCCRPPEAPTKKAPEKGKIRRSSSTAEKSSRLAVVEPFFAPTARSRASLTKPGTALYPRPAP